VTAAPEPTRTRRLVWRAAVVAAALYFVAGGVLALWFPNDGLDFYCSYVAGVCTANHESPYERAVYTRTWDRLAAPASLAETRAFPFAYPPSWIPACLAFSRAPWPVARWLWKLCNVAFLVGSILLTFRLLRGTGLDAGDRAAVWCFALALSPTLTVLTVGQTSLLVLCALLAAAVLLDAGRPALAGLALAVAVTKPQLAAAFVLFLVMRGDVVPLAVGAAAAVALAALGLVLSNSTPASYVSALGSYTAMNGPTSHVAVGIASALAHATALSTPVATAIGLTIGIALLAGLAFRRGGDGGRLPRSETVPVVLYVAPLAFRCHAYDLVALIPLFAWIRTGGTPRALRTAIAALCLVLVVPRAALHLVWERTLTSTVSPAAYQLVERGFRTVVLLLLVPLVLLAFNRRAARRAYAGSADPV
jgi:hypothetical protein